MKARGVGEMMARVGASCGASVVTSSAERGGMSGKKKKKDKCLHRDWVSRVRRAGMIVRRGDNGKMTMGECS